jgi:hypothetical protein
MNIDEQKEKIALMSPKKKIKAMAETAEAMQSLRVTLKVLDTYKSPDVRLDDSLLDIINLRASMNEELYALSALMELLERDLLTQ